MKVIDGSRVKCKFLEPKVAILFYGVAGPNVAVAAYGDVSVQASLQKHGQWKAAAGIEASAGAALRLPVLGDVAKVTLGPYKLVEKSVSGTF